MKRNSNTLPVNLLRRINKRFDWYINKNKSVVLIDKKRKCVKLFDLENCLSSTNLKEDQIYITHEEFKWKVFKKYVLEQFGISFRAIRFREAIRTSRKLMKNLTKVLEDEK